MSESHFASLEQQAHAARFGTWAFLASEVLLFSACFALYAGARAHDPVGFAAGIGESAKTIGTTNTFVLLASSLSAAIAVESLREKSRKGAVLWLSATMSLGFVFFALKLYEWHEHWVEGIVPSARSPYFDAHPNQRPFWTLYWTMTGLHTLHVLAGVSVLAILTVWILRDREASTYEHRLSNGVLYWHLVDVIWIFLWPLFYLAGQR